MPRPGGTPVTSQKSANFRRRVPWAPSLRRLDDQVGDRAFEGGVQRELGLGAGDPTERQDPFEHLVEMIVGPGHDLEMEVTGSRDRMDLEHLGDVAEPADDPVAGPPG